MGTVEDVDGAADAAGAAVRKRRMKARKRCMNEV
jgi:hypothetical protein